MTEPREVADRADEVVAGLHHWHVHNSDIGGALSSSHALSTGDGSVFIDPVRLADDKLAELPRPSAILLTASWHQRAAWRYRRQLGAEVWLPADAPPAEGEPDRRYADDAALPGGLVALRSSSPDWPQYSLLRAAEPAMLFCPDLVWNHGGELHFVTAPGQEVSAATLRSVERLAELPFSILCFAHGEPLLDDPQAALLRLLESQ